ncbi:MAG TPA: DUF4065 domain-containing protein [Candidatus Eisenbergiella merdavium]|uniref:DUF4065 domain-containing protein n=1 Tax=Candidatus Eisenbergiella merdavium TaxID=2838551 RepID=A0A9D2NIR4_9FIRM|nr:DUF4065 domain-containing protein [Candidatus Eisenbergiella merdavium]
MANVFDVAKYILEKKGSMSTWKLQKLCYYSQAWELAWTESPLFDEDFQAWANGPVCPELFRVHQGKFIVGTDDISYGSSDNLTLDQKQDIDIILKDYGDMEPFDLRELSHSEDPWRNARGSLPEGVKCQTVIKKADIGEYYGSL